MINNTKELFQTVCTNVNSHYLNKYLKLISADYNNYTKFEKHHILPKSIFPDYKNEKWNIVKLPLRVHYLVHWILFKMLPENTEMALAYHSMSCCKKYTLLSAKSYEQSKLSARNHMKKVQLNRSRNGVHPWSQKEVIGKLVEGRKISILKRLQDKTHNLLGGEMSRKNIAKMLENGTHPWLNKKPWSNYRPTVKSINTWYLADRIYSYHINYPKDGYTKIYYWLNENCSGKEYSKKSIQTMLQFFKNKWIPIEDEDWLKFKGSQK